MSIHSTARARLASPRLTLRSLRLSSACMAVLAAAAAAGVADAQTAQADASGQAQATDQTSGSQVKEVVVTGIRRSLQDSAQQKKLSSEVVEVISSEDIGKLPDESIADALTRLPGVAGQRVGGRYQDIAIRGLAPDFTATLLNGYQQASTGDNRAAEFDQYPSELISSAYVYKTPDPALVGQGLAGTVDLHSLNPLDLSKRVIALNLRGSTNSLGSLIPGYKSTGERISGAYIDQFFGGKVGLSVGLAYLDAPEMERWYQNWFWATNPGMPPEDAKAVGVRGNDIYAFERQVARSAAMTTLEFKPTSNFHSINNVFVSRFRQSQIMRGVNINEDGSQSGPPENGGGAQPYPQTVTNPTFQTINGQLFNTGGTISGIRTLEQSYYDSRNDVEASYISRNTWDVGGWRLGGDVSYSYAQRKEAQFQEYLAYGLSNTVDPNTGLINGVVDTTDSLTFSNQGTVNGFPQWKPSGNLNYADASKIYLECPTYWGSCWGHDGVENAPTTTDTIAEGKLYAKHDMPDWGRSFFKSVQFGADYSDRTKKKTELDFNLDIPGANVDSGGFLTTPLTPGQKPNPTTAPPGTVPGSLVIAPLPASVLTGKPVNLGWAGFGNIVGYDPRKLIGYLVPHEITNATKYSNNWTVEEKLATFFLKLDIDSKLFTVPVTGNLGFQYVYSTQDTSGYVTQPSPTNGNLALFTPITHSKSYGELLPNLNLKFAVTPNDILHLAVSEEMSRPRLDQLVVNSSAGVSPPSDHSKLPLVGCTPTPANAATCYGSWSGNGGNPDLKPWKATAFDATYERYFGADKASYIAVQYYYKDLSTYIFKQTTAFNFSGYPNLLNYPVAPVDGNIGPNTTWANGKGGSIEGLEIGGTLGGKLISPWVGGWVDGFGVSGSFAKAWTTILQNGPQFLSNGKKNPSYDPSVPLLGLSGTVASWTVFYEKYGFSARLSERYRAPYRADVGGLFAAIVPVEIGEDKSFDAQISYDVPWGPLKGLTLLVEGYNITNSPYREYYSAHGNFASPGNLNYYNDYGRTLLFGVNYKF